MINEHKKGVKAMKYTKKPQNLVAKNAAVTTTSSAGAHYQGKDQKKAAKHGETKHKQKAMAEGFNPEYDDEAGMAHGSLHTLKRAVDGLMSTIDDKDNLPEWCQEKISLAEDYLVTVWDYLQSEKEQGEMYAESFDSALPYEQSLLQKLEEAVNKEDVVDYNKAGYWDIYLWGNWYSGKYYDFRPRKVAIPGTTESEAMEWLQNHADKIYAYYANRKDKVGGKRLLPKPVEKNLFLDKTKFIGPSSSYRSPFEAPAVNPTQPPIK